MIAKECVSDLEAIRDFLGSRDFCLMVEQNLETTMAETMLQCIKLEVRGRIKKLWRTGRDSKLSNKESDELHNLMSLDPHSDICRSFDQRGIQKLEIRQNNAIYHQYLSAELDEFAAASGIEIK